jgi:hypothetical protein
LKNEDCVFDKNFIGQLKSIHITKNVKENSADKRLRQMVSV